LTEWEKYIIFEE